MTEELLRTAPRCVLAFVGARGPLLAPMAFWSDGAALWMATSSSSVKARHLGSGGRGEETGCGVWIPPAAGTGAEPGAGPRAGENGPEAREAVPARGLVVTGRARVFSLDDPIGLATHWPAISTAMTALAVKSAASMAGYALDLPWVPARWLPTNRVVVRVRLERVRAVSPPVPGRGIAPALPSVVPPDVRRALAGQRHVVFAAGTSEHDLWLGPAAWGAGFRLEFGDQPVPVPPATPAVVALDVDPGSRPTQVIGMALHGRLAAPAGPGRAVGREFEAERATWWRGFDVSGARVLAGVPGDIVLPD